MAAGSQNNAHFKYAMELENVNLFAVAVAVEAARRGLFMLPKWKRKGSQGGGRAHRYNFCFSAAQ